MKTAERVTSEVSDNYVFQRSLLAYLEAARIVSGNVLELGTGAGYGIEYIAKNCDRFVTLDKFKHGNESLPENVEFEQVTFPPLSGFDSNQFDFVISFQVIEHIIDDVLFVEEIARVLKPGGKFVVTTPNKPKSITRNPWHVREYYPVELKELLSKSFGSVITKGVFGNEKIDSYYKKNRESVNKITRFDFLDLQHRLPRQVLQIPYDILNRINRRKLLKDNDSLVTDIHYSDYYVEDVNEECFDLFYIATK